MLDRRDFLRTSGLTVAVLAMGPTFWSRAMADEPVTVGPGPYGPLGAADPATGVAVPQGFSVRSIAVAGQPVGPGGYVFPPFPDGSATYALPDGGWVVVVNSEVPAAGQGGASAIEFGPDGAIRAARRILGGTTGNCAGGATPWGTWLSCEEVDAGRVFECDPMGVKAAVRRDALGVFKHEAACVDPAGERVYLTEDVLTDAGLYRFTPDAYPDLGAGVLEIATDGGGGMVDWVRVPDPTAATQPTRKQVPGTLRFDRGEGIHFDTGIVYVATTNDDRVYAYDTATERIEVLYDGRTLQQAPLHEVDNLTVHGPSGDLFVAEDADDLQICVLTGARVVAPFAQLQGAQHDASEMTGVTFNPAGDRMYFSSQRGFGAGILVEVRGPFRTLDPRVTPVVSQMPPPAPEPEPEPEPTPEPPPGPGPKPPPGPGPDPSPGPGSGSGSGAGSGNGAGDSPSPGAGAGSGAAAGSTTSGPASTPGGPAARPAPFALRAKPAARLATIRRQGLAVLVDLQPGPATVRLRAGGRTIAVARVTASRAGTRRLRLRPTRAAVAPAGGRITATLELVQGARRITRPIVLTRPAREAPRTDR